jgi:hypothetical protein
MIFSKRPLLKQQLAISVKNKYRSSTMQLAATVGSKFIHGAAHYIVFIY